MLRVAGRRLSSLSWRSGQASPAVFVFGNPFPAVDSSSNGRKASVSSPAFSFSNINCFPDQIKARWIQTVDVDTGLPVYVPLEVTIKETELYNETSFCEVTPCSLPERAILKAVCVYGPRYWTQVIELCPKEKAWWNSGDKHNPFNSGVLYVKRKVGACSYADDPIGSRSLLSRSMHKMSSLAQ